MVFFRRNRSDSSACGGESGALPQKGVKGSMANGKPKYTTSMLDASTAVVDMQAEVSADANVMFSLLSDPFKHEKIFKAIEGSTARLVEHDGPRKKYELDYQARWKFWKVSGVCQNLLHMETDSEKGTVSFKLREPGFLRVYQGTWSILPVGAKSLSPVVKRSLSALNSPRDIPQSSTSSSRTSSSSCSASQAANLEASLLAAMNDPTLNSPLMGVHQEQKARTIVRVSNMLMSPKISPPYPINHTLKGQVKGQVQDMLDGLLAATAAKLAVTTEESMSLLPQAFCKSTSLMPVPKSGTVAAREEAPDDSAE